MMDDEQYIPVFKLRVITTSEIPEDNQSETWNRHLPHSFHSAACTTPSVREAHQG
jgi:hypothetical protein